MAKKNPLKLRIAELENNQYNLERDLNRARGERDVLKEQQERREKDSMFRREELSSENDKLFEIIRWMISEETAQDPFNQMNLRKLKKDL